ncbi:MAG: ABC transporter permease [Bacteroidota bacterium]
MLKNYVLIALRNLSRQRGYAFINILGLALGLACCLLLLLYVRHELSYDRHHEDAAAIYRAALVAPDDGPDIAVTPSIIAPLLTREMPEVVAATRVAAWGGVVRVGETVADERGFFYVDSTFFDVFTHPLLAGDPATALNRAGTVVLTESMVAKYFGDADPMGQTLLLDNRREFEVTGIVADVPEASHYDFNFLASFATRTYFAENEIWGSANFYTYVRFTDTAAAEAVSAKIPDLLARRTALGDDPRPFRLQPMLDIHLHSDLRYEMSTTGSITYVIGFGIVAALILLIACINYMNLATARSARRAKEVGLRTSLGAPRGQLLGQFYGESALLAAVGLAGAVVLVGLALPTFNTIAETSFTVADLGAPPVLALIAGVFAVVTLVAGSYPALYLSRPEPVAVLRGQATKRGGAAWLRRGLVVFQFAASALLIVGTLVVLAQLRYMSTQALGFDKEQLVTVPINDRDLREQQAALQEQLLQHPGIEAAAALNQVPGQLGWTSGVWGPGTPEDDPMLAKGMPAEQDVLETLGVTMLAGRTLVDAPTPDSTNYQFAINEEFLKAFAWTPEEALGQRLTVDGRRGEVVGVFADFHYASLHDAVEPMVAWHQPRDLYHLVVRLAPGDPSAALDHVSAAYAAVAPHRPMSLRFLDDIYDRQYRNEERLGNIAAVFAGLAIFVACLGLFGLASFTAEQRRREVGIRKVLGASVQGLIGLLTRDFVVLVAVAFALAVPLAWWLLSGWLDGFAYQVGLGPVPFLIAGSLLLAIAVATVGTQALRAAMADPIQALRHE